MQKHIAPLGMAALLVPEQNGVLAQHISIIQYAQNLTEQLEQLAVFIAVHLELEVRQLAEN